MEKTPSQFPPSQVKMVKSPMQLSTPVPDNKIYISLKSRKINLNKFYLKRVEKLINEKKMTRFFVCGLGACVNFAVKFALFCVESNKELRIGKITTSTVGFRDEFLDLETEECVEVKNDRKNNLIEIEILKGE